MKKILVLLLLLGLFTSCYVQRYGLRKQARKNLIKEYERRVQLDSIQKTKVLTNKIVLK